MPTPQAKSNHNRNSQAAQAVNFAATLAGPVAMNPGGTPHPE